ncbi:MAG: transporter substrate-binding domain-containing protein [Marinagarivorans sp.]|nr:transporter substrate-binding domain-containing protein [Marinagarivorans sp.]
MRAGLLALLCCCYGQMAAAELLRIGFGTHKPPYIFEGEPRGLEYDLVMGAAARGGLQLSPYFAPMERLHLMLARGELDAIATTSVRSGVPAFYSDAYIEYHNVAVALTSRQLSITSIADLGRYSISTFQRAHFLLGSDFQAMARRNPLYREEALQINRNRLLYAGRVDLVIGDRRILRYFNTQVADQVDVSQPLSYYPLFPPTPYSVGFRQAGQRDLFNQGLKALRESGDYQRIEQRYAEH